jgi:hypothetical protein
MAVPVALVTFLLDDSSSMLERKTPTMKAFNAYVDVMKKTKGAEIKFSLCKFGGHGLDSSPVQWAVPVQDAVELSSANYNPQSGTDMYRAIVQVIAKIDAELSRTGPRKVVVCIQTDGASSDTCDSYGSSAAGRLVRARQKEGWEFVFMAARAPYVDFMSVARDQLGIPESNVIVYGDNTNQTKAAFEAAGWNVGSFTSGRSGNAGFSEDQRKKAKG